ncbi:MAG TPA: PIN domain-containing protein [Anaerolineales bacterium]
MKKLNIFLDSSALIAGVLSETGAAHVLLLLGESEDILLTVSEMVIIESERSIARKSPRNIPILRNSIIRSNLQIVRDPLPKEVKSNLYLISDPADVPILLAAMKAKVDFLVTHNRRHFLDDPKVANNSGLSIGTPGDALAWIREQI